MTTERAQAKPIDTCDLLELLRQHLLSIPFNLAMYSAESGTQGLLDLLQGICSHQGLGQPPCTNACLETWQKAIHQAERDKNPVVNRCPEGRIGFVVPFSGPEFGLDCLIAGGLVESREAVPPAASQHDRQRSVMVFDDTAMLPHTTREEARATALDIFRALPHLLDRKLHTMSLERTTRRLEAIRGLSRELADCETAEQALAITSEALVVLFDLPKILILLQSSSHSLTLHTTLGLDGDINRVEETLLLEFLTAAKGRPVSLGPDETENCFPGLQATHALLLPMNEGNRSCGVVALIDSDLHARDQAMIDLLVCRLAARLERLRLEEGHERERQYSARLVSMVSGLSLVNSREQLFSEILEMSAELVGACSGSLMILDESKGILAIVSAKGMSPSLARNMSVRYGEGIAGKVAKTGFPMLVNDIERDNRIANRNRPRFKTKSFISLPLQTSERLIGVLNLADKSDRSTFSETDLKLIQTFTGHAIQMIDRAAILEQAGQYEKLSITDPLTGLYNRRFLEKRLQEEINRCQRQNQSFCVILADLDNFKLYNDVCGHLAGDNALRKVAGLMRRTAREMDIVTRYGGEEFCLVLPGTTKKESVFVGERIRRTIEAESFPGETHLPLGRLTVSLGIATFMEDGRIAKDLVHAADLALYRAKAQGRNRLVLYDPSLANQSTLSNISSQRG